MGKFKSVARAVAAWIAVVLSFYTLFVIFNTLVLLPDDSIIRGPSPQHIRLKAEIVAVSVMLLIAFILFAKWAFSRPDIHREPD
jgi:hypothetical protein